MSDIVLQGVASGKAVRSGNAVQVLFDVDVVDVYEGECLAIIGASGSGKSTLTRVLFGLGCADSGGNHVSRPDNGGKRGSAVRRMLRGQTGLVFQDPFALALDALARRTRSVRALPLAPQGHGQ